MDATQNPTKTATETPKKNSAKASMDVLSDATSKNTEIPQMDTSHWLTYPVGRYLIDLPPSAKIYWHPLRFSSQYDLVWKKNMTIEQGRELLIQEAEEAKKAPHKTHTSQFIDLQTDVGINGEAICLMRYPHEFSSSWLLKTYFINKGVLDESLNKKRRTYYYEEKALDSGNMVDETIKSISYMMNNVHSTYPTYPTQPISVFPGTYFEGGLFYGPSDSPYPAHEEIGIEVTFAEFPGIQFSIFFNHLNLDTSSTLGNVYGNLRKAQTTIDGNPATEVLHKFEENGITHYSFSLNGPSTRAAKRIDQIPIINMHFKNPTTGVIRNGVETSPPSLKRPSFKNDEEAMAVWDGIRRNIRWRPDGWRVQGAPEKQYYLVGGKVIPYVVPKQAD